jgi:hypothetical protein
MNQFKHCNTNKTYDPLNSYSVAINERPSNGAMSSGRRNKRSVGEHTKYWSVGKTLKVLVYKLDEHSFEAVKNGASKWLPYINLNFEFIEMDEKDINATDEFLGDIRVDFQPSFNNAGSSAVGTDSLAGHAHDPSMTLGTNVSSPDYESLIIHEFGHALGLDHAHQHPDAEIPWDREKAYVHFENSANFSKAQVDANVFPLERVPGRTYAPYDRYSVMHYQVHNELTVGDWEQPLNKNISEGDIAFMRQIYP